MRRRRVNVLRFGSTSVPWRPKAPKPTLAAALLRLLDK
jgi:hypothetical protein